MKLRKDPSHPEVRVEGKSVLDLSPGELVEVRSKKEILATLDENGTLDGLPFIDEMHKYCGSRLRVLKRVNKILVEGEAEMKRITNTVILAGAICDGQAHGGCQRTCPLLWKEAWLKRDSAPSSGNADRLPV